MSLRSPGSTSAPRIAVSLATIFITGALSAQTAHFSNAQVPVLIEQSITPQGISIDQLGNLLFFDGATNSILKVSSAGGTPSSFTGPIGYGPLYGPAFGWAGFPGSPDGLVVLAWAPSSSGDNLQSFDVSDSGALSNPTVLGDGATGPNSIVSVPLSESSPNTDVLVVFASPGGQLLWTARSSGNWPAATPILGAVGAGGLAMAMLPLANSGAFLAFEGSDHTLYWTQFSGGAWSKVSPFASPNIASPAGSGVIAMALDSSGNLYVTDQSHNRLWEYPWTDSNPIGSTTTLPYGAPVPIPILASGPTGIVPDNSGTLYLSDTGNNRIIKIASTGLDFGTAAPGFKSRNIYTLTFTFDTASQIAAPAVLTGGAANLDFRDAGTGSCTTNGTSHTYSAGDTCTVNVTFTPTTTGLRKGAVELLDHSSHVLATAYIQGTGGAPQIAFSLPTATSLFTLGQGWYASRIAIDESGDIFFTGQFSPANGSGSAGVYKLARSGTGYTFSQIVSTSYPPAGIAVDGGGNVFYTGDDGVSGGGSAVFELSPSGGGYTQSTVLDLGSNNGAVGLVGMSSDGAGNIYVADDGNEEVWIIPPSGPITQISTAFYESGGPYMQDCGPTEVATDSAGNLYLDCQGGTMKLKRVGTGYIPSVIDGNIAGPMALDSAGDVYVNDDDGTLIEMLNPYGGNYHQTPITSGNAGLSQSALAIDSAGNLYTFYDGSDITPYAAPSYSFLKFSFDTSPSLTFAPTYPGNTSTDSPQDIFIWNRGTAPLTFPASSSPPSAAASANFTFGNGPWGPACEFATSSTQVTFDSGAECDLEISFNPTQVGALSPTIKLTDDNLNAPAPTYATQTIALNAFGLLNPAITFPSPGSTLHATTAQFSWTAGQGQATFQLLVGTSGPGAHDVYTGWPTNATSAIVHNIPTNGLPLYVRLNFLQGSTWQWLDYQYSEPDTHPLPALVSPPPRSVLPASHVLFAWTPGPASNYRLLLGTAGVGSADLYDGAPTRATSVTVYHIPAGVTIYARLEFEVAGKWQSADYIYAGPSPIRPAPRHRH